MYLILQRGERDQTVPLLEVALCPTNTSALVRKYMKSQLIVTAAISCLVLRSLKRVSVLGQGNMGLLSWGAVPGS